ncbi:hypothetical protein F5J12DRAFT_878989 [Pisolithus orientalis]|uniref:uncharacterized protein n=1 Tax=Pisolithus orientalis TaxID=936130 RepID=UPI00222436B8|nr:uncharacterized protein F5J12DRAFT_878989 [Pisolithus orientalis]KAI5981690.1 hypothetical protein F5J12DRAFT_878989 [Pisolithus orientalis]
MSLVEKAASLNGVFDSIPIVNIGHASTPEERAASALQIRDACMNVGFFYVRNHGIPEEIIDRVLSALKAYFSLPIETKMKLYHREGANYRGYAPVLDSNIDSENKGDLFEGFVIGWEEQVFEEDDDKEADANTTTIPNIWPSEPARFREAFVNYYHAAVGVRNVLFRLFALALDLPETYFDDKNENPPTMRGHHYPPQTGCEDDYAFGINAHSDFECFTILWQEPGIQALQVLNSDKQWINAPPIPGTLVINIGDLLARWTNDVFRSTVHRVINKSGVRRYSVAMFVGIDPRVRVEPIPSCISSEKPPKYGPIFAGEHVRKRLNETYHRNATLG